MCKDFLIVFRKLIEHVYCASLSAAQKLKHEDVIFELCMPTGTGLGGGTGTPDKNLRENRELCTSLQKTADL